jgi:hypothetical protein
MNIALCSPLPPTVADLCELLRTNHRGGIYDTKLICSTDVRFKSKFSDTALAQGAREREDALQQCRQQSVATATATATTRIVVDVVDGIDVNVVGDTSVGLAGAEFRKCSRYALDVDRMTRHCVISNRECRRCVGTSGRLRCVPDGAGVLLPRASRRDRRRQRR